MSKRQAFSFFVSYYEVAKELSEKDRSAFLWAICQKQFEGIEPNLSGIANFAYIGQKHNIDSQVTGYETKTKVKLTPWEGGSEGGTEPPSVQEKGKGKGEQALPSQDSEINFSGLLGFINSSLDKKFKVVNPSVQLKFKARLKDGYSKEDIFNAITNVSKDDFHKESNFKWATPEYFSRPATLDKYAFVSKSVTREKTIVPHYNSNLPVDLGDGTPA